MSAKQIELRIDRVTVRGAGADHPDQIATAVQRELERYIAEHGVPPHWMGRDAVSVSGLAPQPGPSRAGIGETIARAIYRGGK